VTAAGARCSARLSEMIAIVGSRKRGHDRGEFGAGERGTPARSHARTVAIGIAGCQGV
jgi:hypothetical protein